MKRLIIPALIFVMLVVGYRAVSTSQYRPAPGLLMQVTASPAVTATATPQPTATIIPSATIDYQTTAIIAQQTADEARRVNAIVTAEFEQRIQEQLQMTAQHEQRSQEVYAWTAQAALTTIPLTATQQVISNTQTVQKNMMLAAQLTATANAPTQMVAMENAANYVTFAKVNHAADVVGKFAISLFSIGVVVFLIRFPIKRYEVDDIEPEPVKAEAVTRINLYTNNGTHSEAHDVPCSPDQLSEFAEKFLDGTTLRINNWEGSNTLWTRDVYIPFREWMIKAGMVEEDVKPNGSSQVAPKPELSVFLRGWLSGGVLPAGYEFALHSPSDDVAHNHAESTDKNLILMSMSGKKDGGGGTYPASTVLN